LPFVNVVFDTGAVVAAIYWRNESSLCISALAGRRFTLFITKAIMTENERIAWQLREQAGDRG
jgi:hypothetical protein